MAKLVFTDDAQRDLEEIIQNHAKRVGSKSAQNISNMIFEALAVIERFPFSGAIIREQEFRLNGYRYTVAGKYLCVYRISGDMVLVIRIVHGSSNYPALLKQSHLPES